MPTLVLVAGGLTVCSVVLAVRWLDGRVWRRSLVAYRLRPPAGLTPEMPAAWLGSLSALTHGSRWWVVPHPPLVIEVVAGADGITHYLLMPAQLRGAVLASLRAHLSGARLEEAPKYLQQRAAFTVAAEWRLTSQRRSLAVDRVRQTTASVLAALQPLNAGELICVQWIFTGAGTPSPVRAEESQQAAVPWWLESDIPADADDVRAMRVKQRAPQLHAVGRLGVRAGSRARAYSLFGRVWGTLRQLNAPGAQFVRRVAPVRLVASRMSGLRLPVLAWPVTLNANEAVGVVGLPMTATAVPGLRLVVARQLAPPHGVRSSGTVLAVSNYPGSSERLALGRNDRLRHVYVVGPTGVGKSTLLANAVLQDLQSGDGLALIDPKGDLVSDVLARLPCAGYGPQPSRLPGRAG